MSSPQPYYKNAVIMTDFNCSLSSAQIHMRFQNVFRHTAEELKNKGPLSNHITSNIDIESLNENLTPVVHNIFTIPHGNVDFAGYALYSTYRVLGRNTRPNIFIHVTDPGEGYSNDRSILITDQQNIMIGPNNGTLGLMRAYFESRNIKYDLLPIDILKVEALERLRVGSPTYELPRTFHGRDVFAVVGGLIAGGVDPYCLTPESAMSYEAETTNFAQGLQHLPSNVGDEIEFTVFRDDNFGSLRTNLCTSSSTIQSLAGEDAVYHIRGLKPKGILTKKHMTFPVANDFSKLKTGDRLLYLGSTMSTYWDERFIELSVHREHIGEIFGIESAEAHTMILKRIK